MPDPPPVLDAEGQLHYFEPDVWRALAAVGLIWRDGAAFRCDAAQIDFAQWPELALCDFCGDRPIAWIIDAADFTLPPTHPGQRPLVSTHGWLACDPCGACVTAGDRAALETRVLTGPASARWAKTPDTLEVQRRLLAAFWQHYRAAHRRP